MLNLTQINCNT